MVCQWQQHRSAATCTSTYLAQHYCCSLDFGATGAAATAAAATAAVTGDEGGSGAADTDASPFFKVFPLSASVPGAPPAALGLGARFAASCSWVAWPSLESTLLAKFIGPCIATLSLPMLRRRSRQHTPLSRFRSELGWGSRYRLVRSPLAQGQHERLVGPHRLACLLLGTVGTPDHIVGVEQVAVDDLDDGEG